MEIAEGEARSGLGLFLIVRLRGGGFVFGGILCGVLCGFLGGFFLFGVFVVGVASIIGLVEPAALEDDTGSSADEPAYAELRAFGAFSYRLGGNRLE